MIKNLLRTLVGQTVDVIGKTPVGRFAERRLLDGAMQQVQQVSHQGVTLNFCVPNPLNRYRAESFSTKEPETLEWIDGIAQGAVLWDIGANVGLYSCYAAKRRGCRVFSFEPSVFNLELLARNIHLNGLSETVTIVPLPLSDEKAFSTLNMSSTEWGGALSTFGKSYGQDGKPLQTVFKFSTVGLSMSDAVTLLGIPRPDYVKMDVDGLEHLILKGGASVLSTVKGLLVEIHEDFQLQISDSAKYLTAAGLEFIEKRNAETDKNSLGARSFNQIWRRPASN